MSEPDTKERTRFSFYDPNTTPSEWETAWKLWKAEWERRKTAKAEEPK